MQKVGVEQVVVHGEYRQGQLHCCQQIDNIDHEKMTIIYALFSCICTVIFGRFLKDVVGCENVRKE